MFDALYASPEVHAATDPTAWVQAMLDVEAALARAGAATGRVPAEAAAAIVERCRVEDFDVSIFARGLLDRVVTRIYFGDEPAANDADPTLSTVDKERRHTLIAAPDGAGGYTFDIRLQGDSDNETVFFDV